MLKVFKRIVITVFVILMILLFILLVVLPAYIVITNNIIAHNTMKVLEKTKLSENTEIVDSISIAGKVDGNGNGMQYFGAILLKTDLSESELNEYYGKYRENEWSFVVKKQNSSEIDVIDRLGYSFENYNDAEKNKYYIVYSFGSPDNVFLKNMLLEWDLRGH